MSSVPPEERASNLSDHDLIHAGLPSKCVLGVQWLVEDDNLGFKIQAKEQPYTRRGVWSVISSIYDPLGFVVPIILREKQILQDLCVASPDWDETLPQWQEWKKGVSQLSSFTTPQLDDDSLRTLLAETTAIMSSRPLTVENLNDPTSLAPLTPSQILTQKTSVVVPPPGNVANGDLYSRKRWRRVQHLANVFWSRWKRKFLMLQQQRQKWSQQRRGLKENDVVLIEDESLPRCQWKLGRVVETYPSADGLVRKVRVMVGDSTLDTKGKRQRSVSYLDRIVHKLVLRVEASNK